MDDKLATWADAPVFGYVVTPITYQNTYQSAFNRGWERIRAVAKFLRLGEVHVYGDELKSQYEQFAKMEAEAQEYPYVVQIFDDLKLVAEVAGAKLIKKSKAHNSQHIRIIDIASGYDSEVIVDAEYSDPRTDYGRSPRLITIKQYFEDEEGEVEPLVENTKQEVFTRAEFLFHELWCIYADSGVLLK